MADVPSSSQTISPSSPPLPLDPDDKLDLSHLPPIFVSATHFETEDLHKLEDQLTNLGALLTYDLTEAGVILSKVTRKPRILFDLKAKGLWTEEVKSTLDDSAVTERLPQSELPASNTGDDHDRSPRSAESDAIVIDDSSTASETEDRSRHTSQPKRQQMKKRASPCRPRFPNASQEALVRVVRIDWFHRCLELSQVLPLDSFVTYQGLRVNKPGGTPAASSSQVTPRKRTVSSSHSVQRTSSPVASIIERAKEDAPSQTPRADRFGKRKFGQYAASSNSASWEAGSSTQQTHAHLLHTTTSEHDLGVSSDLPEMPEWVKAGVKYACQRLTPKDQPNDAFIALLKKIKTARLLTNDEIGVRAYSTSIAALAAYPHKVINPREIMALPGCDAKIANLYIEWVNTGAIKAVDDIEADDDLKILRLFYDIWGVGATTAREFYFDKGWRELDDIVDYGWKTLSRVQQIGVKFYDEFLDQIPRAEVEQIGRIVHRHACKVRDDGCQSLIVGGYRRGKEASGDVDIIVSHPDEKQTLNIVNDIVYSLEEERWITHTLLLSLNSTNRGQQTLPFRTGGGGHGFDTLDKALVVWQDPDWPSKHADLAADPKAKNPNIHRRVDIIISPWRTVGCAVLGWSAGMTFERDLRRYAKDVKGWKFDSSGVRSRGNGEVVDVEGFSDYAGRLGEGRATTMEQAEKRVFEAMGLTYREPWERCTG